MLGFLQNCLLFQHRDFFNPNYALAILLRD